MSSFAALSEEYNRFAEIRNHPAEDVEYEDWQTLPDAQIIRWRNKLQLQGQVVKGLITALDEGKKTQGHHELEKYFSDDIVDLKAQFKKRDIEFTLT